MPQHVLQSTEMESRLREGLSALRAVARQIGATGVSVFLVKDGRTVRNLSMWPESGKAYADQQELVALA